MRSLRHPTLTPQVIAARVNLAAAIFYGLLGLFGLLFVGDSEAAQGALLAYVAVVLVVVGAHCALWRGAHRGARWARWGSVLAGALVALTGVYGVVAGPLIGLALIYFSLQPWDLPRGAMS